MAQTWPKQPLRVIIPGQAGSAPDVMMRLIGDKLTANIRTPVIIDNRPGAGGIVAVQTAAAARDQHTAIFMLTGVAAITPLVVKSAKYDVLRDFVPIAGMAETSLMMAAAPNSTARTIPDIIKLAKEKPGTVVLGHPGIGTLGHLMVESFAKNSGAKFLIAPFSPMTGPLALLNGDAQYFVDGIASVIPFVKSQRTIGVAVFSSTVLPGLEDYKLANESMPNAEAMGRFGLMASKDMPPEAITAISVALGKALADPEVIAKLREFATYPAYTTGAAYAATIGREQALWSNVAREANLQAQ